MQLYSTITKEIEESAEGPQVGAFFDFDGTIIYGYSATKYLQEQIKRGDVKPLQLVEIVKTMARFSLGNMGFSAMMTETSSYLKGIDESEYLDFAESLYEKHIAKLIYPETRALIEAHLKKGHTVGLISAATPYQVIPAARDLGIKHIRCTNLATENGRFTGEVIRPTCYGMGKVVAADDIANRQGVDMAESFFYTDSDEDIQLLEHVGKPRPLNPNSRLRGIARGRGWPVKDFTSRGGPKLSDYIRTFATQGAMVGSALAALPMYALTGSVPKARNFSIGLFADLATALTGMEIEVEGEEHVWENRPCVFVFNHQSQADTIIVPWLLRRDLAGVGKKEISKIPILGKIMEYGGTVLIDRANTASAVEAMAPLVDVMRNEGRSVCIAPEGTRSTSTALGRFKKGPFHLAIQAGVPVVPIVIHNAIDVAPRGQFVFKPATVKVTVLPPVDTSNWSAETIDQHVDVVRDMFLVELDQMHLQRPAAQTVESKTSIPKQEKSQLKRKKSTQPKKSAKKTKKKVTKAVAKRVEKKAIPNAKQASPRVSKAKDIAADQVKTTSNARTKAVASRRVTKSSKRPAKRTMSNQSPQPVKLLARRRRKKKPALKQSAKTL